MNLDLLTIIDVCDVKKNTIEICERKKLFCILLNRAKKLSCITKYQCMSCQVLPASP